MLNRMIVDKSGLPVLEGTRMPICQIIAEIAEGRSVHGLARSYNIDAVYLTEFLLDLSSKFNTRDLRNGDLHLS